MTTATRSMASQHATALLNEIKRQSKPRRLPWQHKTIRDLLEEGRADLVDLAITKSNILASAAAEQRDSLVGEVRRQSQPRRFFWQEKTAYDKLAEQRERLATNAVDRANALAEAARLRREQLLATARKQAKPRRWRWQEPTLRDRFDTRSGAVRESLASTLPVIQTNTETTLDRARSSALQTAAAAQQGIAVLPQRLGNVATATADTVRGTTQQVAHRVAETAGSAAQSVKSVALVPVDAVRSGVEAGQHAVTERVEAGKRSLSFGMRLLRTLLWGLLIGAAIGVLIAPRAGEETRRNLTNLWEQILDLVGMGNNHSM